MRNKSVKPFWNWNRKNLSTFKVLVPLTYLHVAVRTSWGLAAVLMAVSCFSIHGVTNVNDLQYASIRNCVNLLVPVVVLGTGSSL